MVGRWWRRGEDETPEPEPKSPPLDRPAPVPAPDAERLTFRAPHVPHTPPPASPDVPSGPAVADVRDQLSALAAKVDAMSTQLSRLAREQLRANEIGERALREARESAALARTALDRPSPAAREVRLPTGRPALPISTPAEPAGEPEQKALRVLESLMPVLDAIEAGLESGRGQLEHLDDAQARMLLAAWLDGQRLLRERILSLFEREGIRPIGALGQRFDPFRHVAVERTFDPLRLPGIIVAERRRGYEVSGRVLRFAEVVVTTDQAEDGQ